MDLKFLTGVHVGSRDLPTFQGLVHTDLEDSGLLRFILSCVLEFVAGVCKCFVVHGDPVEGVALPALFTITFLTQYLNTIQVLLDFVNAVVKMIISIIKNL